MSDQEVVREIAAKLFGPKGETESSEPVQPESEGADQPERPPSEAVQHDELLAALFKSNAAKLEADQAFFNAPGFRVEPPDEGA